MVMRAPVSLVCLLLSLSLAAAEIPISHPEVVPMEAIWQPSLPVVVAGEGFIVVWQENYGFAYGGSVKLRTYDASRAPRQELPLSLGGGVSPRAFWNGSEYVVVYAVNLPKYGAIEPVPAILAKRVRPDGSVVEDSTATLVMSRASGGVYGIAFDGEHALAVAGTGNGFHELLLDRTGALVPDTPRESLPAAVAVRPGGGFFVLPRTQGTDVAAGGERLAVVTGPYDQWGAVTATILDAAGAELEQFIITERGGPLPRIVWDRSAWIAVYAEKGALCTARFTGTADLVRDCEAKGSVYTPSIAPGPRGAFTAWIENREIHIGGIASDGRPRPERRVAGPLQPFDDVRLARAGGRTLLLWSSYSDLYAMDLERNVPLRLGTGSEPKVAARGEEWVVVWSWQNAIRSVHLSKDLSITASETFAGTAQQATPAIAASPSGWLVAWFEAENGIARVVVEPLDARGRRITGGNRIAESGDTPLAYPRAGCNEINCIVTWYSGMSLGYAFVDHDGTRLTDDRFFPVKAVTQDVVIQPVADRSWLVHRGNTYTPLSAGGFASPTVVWHNQPLFLGKVVTWRGRTTAVYARTSGGVGRVVANEFVPRGRAVRR
jgi:hypothetical protein